MRGRSPTRTVTFERVIERSEWQRLARCLIDHRCQPVDALVPPMAQKLGVTPQDNAVSQSLQSAAADARKKLEPLHGAAFDRAYMDREIVYHQGVLDAIDKVLIPTTENAELKTLLQNVRPAVATHLEHAKALRAKLGGRSRKTAK